MTGEIKHLHWPAYIHEHACGDHTHAHVIKGGCASLPSVETILFDDDVPEGQDGRFFNVCPLHGRAK